MDPPPAGRPEEGAALDAGARLIAAGVEDPDEAGTMVGNSEDIWG